MGGYHLPERLGQIKEGCARRNERSGMPWGCVSPVQVQKDTKELPTRCWALSRVGCRLAGEVWSEDKSGDKFKYTATGRRLDSSSTSAIQQVSPSHSGRCRALYSGHVRLIILAPCCLHASQLNAVAILHRNSCPWYFSRQQTLQGL